MKRTALSAAASIALLASLAVAQKPEFTFKAATRLVVEAVTVIGRDGKPIAGLTAKDFAITEEGVPQHLAFCNYQNIGGGSARPAPPAPASQVPPPTAVRIAPEVPGGPRYSNRALVALYFDLTSLPTASRQRALHASGRFLASQMRPGVLAAILSYDGAGVQVLSGFTSDPDALSQALRKLQPSRLLPGDATFTGGSAFGQDGAGFNLFRTNRQLDALRTAIDKLARIRERKSLVYFADGLNLTVDNEAQLQATVNAAINANVQIFPIDARGLSAAAPAGSAAEAAPGGSSIYTGVSQTELALQVPRSQDSLYALGSDTGGTATFDTNELARGIIRARDAIGSYYELGYYTSHTAKDGSYRPIRITVLRHPGARLRYRKGYYAEKTFAKFTTGDKERQLEDALLLPNPITDLDLELRAHYFQIDPAEYFIPVAVKIPGNELALAKHDATRSATIDFIGEVKDSYGTTMTNLRDAAKVKLSAGAAAQLAHSALEYTTGFTLLPGNYSVKLLARDDVDGRIGTYIKHFTVPNLARVSDRIPLSSLVVSDQSEPIAEGAGGRRTNIAQRTELAASPLVHGGVQLMPAVRRSFPRSARLTFLMQAYEHPPAKATEIEAYVGFYRNGRLVYETPLRAVPGTAAGEAGAISIRLQVALRHLPPAPYTAQVTVLDPARQLANFRRSAIVVTMN